MILCLGAFGVVYQAKWRGASCVVKQLNINNQNEKAVELFLKEAYCMLKLRVITQIIIMS